MGIHSKCKKLYNKAAVLEAIRNSQGTIDASYSIKSL